VPAPATKPARRSRTGEAVRFVGHENSVVCVAFFPDGSVLSGSHDGTVRQWDVDSGDQRRCLRIQGSVQALALPRDARWVACGGVFQRVHLVDLTTGQEVQQFDHQGGVNALAVTPRGDRVLSGGLPHDLNPARTVRLWDVASRSEVRSFGLPMGNVTALAISGDGRRALCAGVFRTARDGESAPSWRVWDLETGDTVFERATADAGFANAAVLSADGRRVLAPDHAGRSLSLWDLDAGKELKQMPNRSHICSIAMSPDGTRGVAGRADGSIDIYDLQQGQTVTTFATRSGPILAMTFSPDGRCAVSGGTDRLVRLWHLPR
jgi:WD40 repeat protein